MAERMSFGRRVAYALGNPGFMIPDRIVVVIAFYYYLPPEGPGLATQLPDGVFLGFLTAWGIARLAGGLVDSLADPFVGFASDRSASPLGRRRSFLIFGVLPMVLAPPLLFWPPWPPGSLANAFFLGAVLSLYYVFFTVYVGPYLALIPELARDTQDRVGLSSLMALAAFPALLLFQPLWLAGVEWGRDAGLTTEEAVRLVVVALTAVALLLCLLPILAVDEKRFAQPSQSTLPMREAILTTLRSRPFLVYLAAQICFILGVTMLQPAIPYFAIVLLGRDEGFAATLSLVSVPFAVIGFFALQLVTSRVGPRASVMGCVALLAVGCGMLGAIEPGAPGSAADGRNLWIAYVSMALTGLSLAGFMVLPHVLMSQVIDLDELETGANRSAMFYGVQGLATKWVYQVSLALLGFLLARYGASAAEPLGVRLIGPVAAALCLASFAIYAFYPERRLQRALLVGRDQEPRPD
ncbi:MAG: MFS transporter [Myxococcota bacterium]|nr:MFS transporter [Myxococcota bacterium]